MSINTRPGTIADEELASASQAATARRPTLRTKLPPWVVAHTGAVKALGDVCAWPIGIVVAAIVRWDLSLQGLGGHAEKLAFLVAAAATVQVLLGNATGLYRNHWRFASFEEVAVVAETAAGTLLILLGGDLALRGRSLPWAVALGATFVAVCTMAALRYTWRLLEEIRLRPSHTGRHMLVFGAGEGTSQLLQSVLRNPASPYLPVAILDDDPNKCNLRIKGVRVFGDRTRIAEAAERFGADLLVLAVPSANSSLVRDITDLARPLGLDVRVLPPTSELLERPVTASDIRTPTIGDLLGRRPVQTDIDSIASYLRGRRVLVTGAGGSIGSELARQVATFKPAELMLLDRDESALHAVQLSLDGRGMLDSPDLLLVDIRDHERVRELFSERLPEVVFHAAALKHLTLLESHPAEAVKSNVWATQNLLDAAMACGTQRFVNVSTDKAADPVSVLGYSKRIAERLTARAAAVSTTGRYLSVRFGNVLGSRGSVLPAFKAQIQRGGPVLVTDRGVMRYFMTIEEAVQLVIQAGAIGPDGSTMILDMGEPVSIDEVAKRMVRESGRDIEIVYTGLRQGEKLREQLFAADEQGRPAGHPLLSQVAVPPLDVAKVIDLPVGGGTLRIRKALANACYAEAESFAPDDGTIDLREDLADTPHTGATINLRADDRAGRS